MIGFEDYTIKAILSAFIGYLFYKVKKMEDKIDNAVSEKAARQIIEDKLEPLKVAEVDVKDDIKRLEAKIDMLIKLQLDSHSE